MMRLGTRAAAVGFAGVAALFVSACAPQGPRVAGLDGVADFARLGGVPDLNGLWQANGTANWNLEAHSAAAIPGFWGLGAIAAVPAGISYVEGGTIPYRPEARAQRDANRAGWPAADPEARCYMPGIPRATYMPYPFHIVQGNRDMLFAYEFASANRKVNMVTDESPAEEAVIPTWMGTSNGHWEGDTLVVVVTGNNELAWYDRAGNYRSTNTVVTERFTKVSEERIDYSATIEDPTLYTRPWTIRLPLYRRSEAGAQLLEFKCVPFSEELIYGNLTTANQPPAQAPATQ